MNYLIFKNIEQVLNSLSEKLDALSHHSKPVHVSLSGGSTPKEWFKTLSRAPWNNKINWSNVHFWWGDERMVDPSSSESNYGEAFKLLLDPVKVPITNIHRIKGELSPQVALELFKQELQQLPQVKNLPQFDLVVLGMGEDGHTASLFPGKTDYNTKETAVIAEQPETGQLRITNTAAVLNNAKEIIYLVTGVNKATKVYYIAEGLDKELPAAKIKSPHTVWYLDSDAAQLLNNKSHAATMATCDIGVIGLAVMGQNLILNMNDHGFKVAAFNRTVSKVDEFLAKGAKGTNIVGVHSVEELCQSLKTPRRIMLMVKAGDAVDQFIKLLLPHLEAGDIIIDGGNSNYPDSTRRVNELAEQGILYVGAGVSGGEEGARTGPSIMPGGNSQAWDAIKPIFQAIAAKTPAGEACCDWIGPQGSGHFVKMVHNGIEYGDMQLICEVYAFMEQALGLNNQQMQEIFATWNKGELESYLIEITANILSFKQDDGSYLVDKILDKAGQKGTGKWTGINALDLGTPLTLISESVFARIISSLKEQRIVASKLFARQITPLSEGIDSWVSDLSQALLAAKVISYAQGFMLMKQAANHYGWSLNYGNCALIWREGCIIRSKFLGNIRDAFDKEPNLEFLGLDPYFHKILSDSLPAYRRVVSKAIELGIAVPCLTSGLTFLDGYTTADLPANLLQAQRDYFGAHGYQLKDDPNGEWHHNNWTGTGGDTASSNYDV